MSTRERQQIHRSAIRIEIKLMYVCINSQEMLKSLKQTGSNLSVNRSLYVVVELRDRSHLCYKSIINYDLDITNFLVISLHIRFIEVFDITNPPFDKQICSVPSDFLTSRFHCTPIMKTELNLNETQHLPLTKYNHKATCNKIRRKTNKISHKFQSDSIHFKNWSRHHAVFKDHFNILHTFLPGKKTLCIEMNVLKCPLITNTKTDAAHKKKWPTMSPSISINILGKLGDKVSPVHRSSHSLLCENHKC